MPSRDELMLRLLPPTPHMASLPKEEAERVREAELSELVQALEAGLSEMAALFVELDLEVEGMA